MTIVQNSLLVRFFIALGTVLENGWRSSLLGKVLSRLWGGLVKCWTGSGLRRFLDKLEEGVRRAAAGSGLCRFVSREGAVSRSWPGSFTCRAVAAVVNLPCAFAKWLYKVGGGVLDGSVLFKAMSAAGGATCAVVGVLLLVMLVAPHAVWNNLYCVAGALLAVVLFAVGAARRPRARLEVEGLSPWYILFMAFVVYGMVCSLDPALSVRFFLFHMGCFLIVVLTVSSVHRVEQLQLTLILALVGLTVASLYGCYQGAVGVEVVASQQDMSLNAGMPGRIYSFFDNPNNFAELLAMLIPFLLAFFLNAESKGGKVLSVAALAVCLAAIGMTLSRSSWIGLAVAVAVFLALKNWRFVPLFLVLGLCAIPFLPKSIYNRILTIGNMQDSSARYRLSIYEASFTMLKDHGLRGVGLDPDVVREVFRDYPPMFDGNHPIHTHNNYVQMWAELGLIGGISYLVALLAQLKRGVKSYWSATDSRVKNLLGAALGGFCGIMVIGLAEYTWFYPRNMFVYWFLFGVIAACVKLAGKKAEA